MKYITFSILSLLFFTNSAFANCQWTYLNQLNKDIKHAQDLLSDYSTCRSNCRGLEVGLNRSLAKMSKTASCGAYILTASNAETINFIGGRFKLIQKQKSASTWAEGSPKNRVTSTVSSPLKVATPSVAIPSVALSKPAFVKPPVHRTVHRKLASVPEAQRVEKQTKMVIPRDAYAEVWDENSATKQHAQQITNRAKQNAKMQRQAALRSKQHQANVRAKQQHLAQQRLDKHLKMALIQQEKIQLVKTKRRAMQKHLQKQRLIRQQYLKKRAMAIRVNRQKVHQQRMARAQKLRRR